MRLFFTVFIITWLQSLQCLHGRRTQELTRLNYFDIDLLRYCAEDKQGNVVVSPASIKSVLAMMLEGARGTTSIEIRDAMRLSPEKDDYREQLNSYLNLLKANTTGVQLHNANAVFVSNKLKLKKDFEVMLRKLYFTDLRKVNFSDPFNSSDTINSWVNYKTKGLIPKVVERAHISPLLDMFIVNALYFKSKWQHAFNPKNTRPGCFYKKEECMNVTMMELHAQLNYAFVDNLRAHVVELPYEGGRYSMVLLVPLDRDGSNGLLRDLPYMNLPQISQLMEPTDVRLVMPKFNIEFSENMVEALRRMHIHSLFSTTADLSGMYEGGSPQVNSVLHQVYMTVDETGTVAAASTSAMVIPLIENGVQLRVDHPFVFFIRDNESEGILFEGKIDEPTAYVAGNGLKDQQPKYSRRL